MRVLGLGLGLALGCVIFRWVIRGRGGGGGGGVGGKGEGRGKCMRCVGGRDLYDCGDEVVQGAVLLMVGRSYVGNDVTHSMLLDRAGACSYQNLPKYRSYCVSNTAPR